MVEVQITMVLRDAAADKMHRHVKFGCRESEGHVPLYSKLDHDSSEYIGKKAGQRITL
jgi:hypothetical protein